jgi:hypothetical protein
MKLKEILKNNVYSHFDGTNPTLSGSGLKALKPFFNDIEEFNGKTIEVIDTLDGLVTVKGVENLRENVKIQTLFLIDDDVFIRCTADSLKIESLYKTSGLEMGQITTPVDGESVIKKESAVEFLVESVNKKGLVGLFTREELNQAKEIEKQKGYSEEEFLEFSEWVSHNDWVYLPSKGYWVNEEQEELEQKITTKQLFEQFKTNNV